MEYAYDDLNRLETLSNKATGGGVMTSFGYTYDDDGNITRVDLNQNGAASAWAYVYDNLNRLQFEERRDSANDPLWRRRYDYDDAGNRASMKHWRDDTNTTSTVTYSYNGLNQLTSRSSPERDYYYDAFGNLTSMNDAVYQHTLSWTLDNRLKEVSMDEGATVTQYAYDYQGARILRTDDDGTIRRYYFRGLTEEVVKESVAASPGVNDFAYTEKEDGASASEWYGYYGSPSISAVDDTAHHPLHDGASTGKVILVNGTAACVAVIGDNDAGGYNPNDTAWNSTKRVLSFWYKGGFNPLRVAVTTSAGSKEVHYYTTSGTDAVDGSGNVVVYLGTSAAGSTWLRFERDAAADWTRVTGGASTWTNTDGLAVQPSSAYSYDLSIDDIRLSNARTMTHNSLTGGAIGQIASSREVTSAGGSGSMGLTDAWYHYDHIGNVMNFSNSSGALVANSIQHQDAWGNVLSSSTTGAWATMTDGRHLTTKEYDADAGMYYFWQRWYEPELSMFYSVAPRPPELEHPYRYVSPGNPIRSVDPTGEQSFPGYGYPIQPMPGESPRQCALRIVGIVRGQFPVTRPESDQQNHMRHCVASCTVSQQCGGNAVAFIAGWWNEYAGVYDPKDTWANAKGRNCGGDCKDRDCYSCCRDSFNPNEVVAPPPSNYTHPLPPMVE